MLKKIQNIKSNIIIIIPIQSELSNNDCIIDTTDIIVL